MNTIGILRLNNFIKLFYYILVTTSCFTTINCLAQQKSNQFKVDYGYGSILKHKTSIGHLVEANPELLRLTWVQSSDSTLYWKNRFNFPSRGISLVYQDFHSRKLGKIFGVNYLNTFYLLNRNSPFKITCDLGLGFAYANSPFNLKNNNQNNVISSAITYSNILGLNLQTTFKEHLLINLGVNFTHFSNASFRKPNNGINTVFLNLGVGYIDKKESKFPHRAARETIQKTPLRFGISSKLGFHEAHPNLGVKPVYEFSPFICKQISKLGYINAGLDFMLPKADKLYAEYVFASNFENPNKKQTDYKRIGLFAGFEHLFNKISTETDLGYYLYQPMDIYGSIYQNIRIKYAINNNLKVGLGVKLHLFKANYSTIELQYKW